MSSPPILQFQPFSSLTHPSFWHKFTSLKLDVLKLDDSSVPITASYTAGRTYRDRESGKEVYVDSTLSVDEESFAEGNTGAGKVVMEGVVKNYNTIEEFKKVDKSKLFAEIADDIWHTKTSKFLLITYADLKKYKYYYWFAFPAFVAKPPWHITSATPELTETPFSNDEMSSILTQITQSIPGAPYFLIRDAQIRPFDPSSFDAEHDILGFVDPSSQPHNPGWPLRNLLAFIPSNTKTVRVLCWRDSEPPRDGWKSRYAVLERQVAAEVTQGTRPDAVGWEKNPQGKLAPRVVDLAPMMDPTRLANQAVNLNLKLMRWRILPSLDLDKIATTKCLLLGAGTLGCYVARGLMAWGVHHITLVDSGRVSFSNPVRQPLFTFEDCLNGGKPKAECAAQRMGEIWPGVNATGHTLSIPMPGHPVPASPPSAVQSVRADVEKLEKLIEEHDAVFLLMDSRESRWLPTVLGRAKGKPVINAALGFDTFLVMRHGARGAEKGIGQDLGCYYCNDIVAPADSLSDRTLDQMCTVTRPGIASIASSTAVELMMSVLMHPDGIHAAAPPPVSNQSQAQGAEGNGQGESVLGLVPHQLRGYLAQFRNMHIVGARYERCTGCSDIVLDTYTREGFSMLLKAFNEPKYLEQLTGLDKLFEEGEKALEDVDWVEEGDGGSGDDF